jgi:hypothetical protein
MSGWYRFGEPGADCVAHLNTGRNKMENCVMPRFPKDDPKLGEMCRRVSVALCDAPGCDKPVCSLHRWKHKTKANTDFCLDHADQAAKPL